MFRGYKGITPSLQKVVFRSPFRPLYHRWDLFTEIVERQKRENDEAAAHSVLLYDELKKELGDVMSEIKDHLHHGVITYYCQYNRRDGYLSINVNFVDWDGKGFGYARSTVNIPRYDGTQSLTSLSAYPACLHPAQEEARAKAIDRGQNFRELLGFQYKAYSGSVWTRVGGSELERNVDGRIIVDALSYFDAKNEERPSLSDLGSDSIAPKIDVNEDHHFEDEYNRGPVTPQMYDVRTRERERERIRQRRIQNGEFLVEKKDPEPSSDLTDEQLLLCTTRLRGYSLKLKRWVQFDVDNISDIAWNEDAFPQLILPEGFQNLILSFVEAQSDSTLAFDDIIQGKGMGIIMLLVGTPGTGKTLTAEAVADKVRKPLYVLSAGEVGQDATNVEHRLSEIMELTQKWDAIVLFDECDVFLQERSTSNMAHNEIVAVFLRLLEYYRGIIFMTTNRASSIDSAFQSRIHLTLHYPELNIVATEKIWRQLTSQLERDETMTDETYDWLAELSMNGRQIKNTVKISALLAHKEKARLGFRHIRTVLNATREEHDYCI
ncbi:unnamed protein product [Penicillium salamii]|nr:unnamed protein product [Penicillium salamii]CAG8423770.1 unnamed protein product [Penicillium salamii]